MVVLALAVSAADNACPATAPATCAPLGVEQVVKRIFLCSKCKQPKKGHVCMWMEGDGLPVATKRKRTADLPTIEPMLELGRLSTSVLTKQTSAFQVQHQASVADKKEKKNLFEYLAKNEQEYPVQNKDYLRNYLAMLNDMSEEEVKVLRLLQARVRRFTAEQFELVDDPVLQT